MAEYIYGKNVVLNSLKRNKEIRNLYLLTGRRDDEIEKLARKKDINIEELKEKLFPALVNSLTNLDLDKSLEYFRKHNYLLNKRVKAIVNNQTFIGGVVGIDDSFCLQVATHGMLLYIDSGEIEIL